MSDERILEKRIGENIKAAAPRVSIVIPAYNVAEFIGATLDSALAQTFSDYEIILVNDGSPDTEKLETVLRNYFGNIVYIKQKNGGAARARNAAIENARGELLAFLDGDDLWLPEYLESQLALLEEKQCDLVYCDALLFGDLRNQVETFMGKSPSSGRVTTESLINGTCNVITSGTIVKREKVLRVGMFDPDLPPIGMEDFDLWFRLAKAGAVLDYQKRVLIKYRVRSSSLSGTNIQRAERNVVALEVFEEKYDLTEREKAVLKNQLRFAAAELSLEKAKFEITRENYRAARTLLRDANEYYRKPKFSLLIFLLAVNPKLVLHFFKRLRPADFSFISPEQK